MSFGNVNLGASSTQTITFNFNSPNTLSDIQVLTQGTTGLDFRNAATGTCTATTYTSGQSCTVDVAFAPIAPGLRMGAVVLSDSSGSVMTTYISGIGIGPQIVFDPGSQSTVGTGFNLPVIALPDSAGNVYIGDDRNLITVPAAGGPQSSATYGMSIQGLAIDGAGNLYASTDTLQGVIEIPRGCTTDSCTFPLAGSGLGSVAAALAIDGEGAVYAAEYNDNRVVKIPQGCASSTCVIDIADSTAALGGLNDPEALAVDASGNVYIADTGNARIVKIPPNCMSSSCQITIFSGIATVLTLDSAGNLYFDRGVLLAGANSPKTILALPGSLNSIAIDNSGSLYVASASAHQVYKFDRTSTPAFSFSSEPFETASTPQMATLTNIGNADLTFNDLTISPPVYAQQATNATDCSADLTLLPGALCNLQIVFTPSSIGAVTGSITLKDNTLNNASAQQVIPLTGSGIHAATTLALMSSANPSGIGLGVTFTATTAPTTGTGVPGGAVTFLDNNIAIGSGTLSNGVATLTTSALPLGTHSITATYAGDANFTGSQSSALDQVVNQASTTITLATSASTAAFGSTVTFSAVLSTPSNLTPTGSLTFMDGGNGLGRGTISTSNGITSATLSTGALAAGHHSITASYAGDANFSPQTSSALDEFIVRAPTTAVIASSANPAFSGAPITFTVTVSSSSPVTPTGSVSLVEDTIIVNTGSLDGSGHASFSTNTGVSPLSPGLHSISAVYFGDANFLSNASQPILQTINEPTAISVTPAASTVTIASGQSTTVPITLAGNGTFVAASVVCRTQTISCLVQPASTTVSLTPSSVTLTISTASVSASNMAPGLPFGEGQNPSSSRLLAKAFTRAFTSKESALTVILALPLIVFFRPPQRDEYRIQQRTHSRNRTAALVLGLLLGVAAATSACGGGSSGSGGGGGNKGVPAGNYSVMVTVTGSSTSGNPVVSNAVINVVVQ